LVQLIWEMALQPVLIQHAPVGTHWLQLIPAPRKVPFCASQAVAEICWQGAAPKQQAPTAAQAAVNSAVCRRAERRVIMA